MFCLVLTQCYGQYHPRFGAGGVANYGNMDSVDFQLGMNVLEDESLACDRTCPTPCFKSLGSGIDSLIEFQVSRLGNSCEKRLS